MATYVNYKSMENRPITILNFVFVNDYNEIQDGFQDYTRYDNTLFDNKSYIAIRNSSNLDGLPGNDYQNLSVCASTDFPVVNSRREAESFP